MSPRTSSLMTPLGVDRVMHDTVRGGRRTRVVLAMLATLGMATPLQEREGPVAVRFVEGTLHGYLRLRNTTGDPIAEGELLQVPSRRGLDSRKVFRFRDSSFFEERVVFTQREVFRMASYALVQRGPSFAEDLEVNLEGSGKYDVKATSHDDGEVTRTVMPGSLPTVHLDSFVSRARCTPGQCGDWNSPRPPGPIDED